MDEPQEDEVNPVTASEERLDPEDYDTQQGYYPEPARKETFIGFLKKIIGLKDSTKVSNLGNEELANVRIDQNLANFADLWDWDLVAKNRRMKAEVTLATAMSKKGWFMATSVTQVRKVERTTGTPAPQSKKWWQRQQRQEPGGYP